MNTTLLIMAAGIGSRFGGGIKQLEPVGMSGEIIMDYSIHDAIAAGFNKIVFVIRKEIEQDFRECIGKRVEAVCDRLQVQVCYAYQELDKLPEGFTVPQGRTKPWGTGQAVLAAKQFLREPFMVINADDYYGKQAFCKIHDYLCEPHKDFCMAGYILKNTLSEHGGVTRGVCKVEGEMLCDITETKDIEKTADGVVANGKRIDPDSCVSMNMWGFPSEEGREPEYLAVLEQGFEEFLRSTVSQNPLQSEYLIPINIGELLNRKEICVRVLKTSDKWFGVTYREDKAAVVESFRKLIEDGVYGKDLYADLF